MMLKNNNEEFIADVVASIENEIGKGFAIRAEGDYVTSRVRRVISTGCFPLDAICCKTEKNKIGLPVGRTIEVIGPEGAGKTTLLLHICKSVYESGGINVFFEGEHKFDPEYAEKLGAKFDIFSQPDTLEDVLDALTASLKKVIEKKEIYREDYKNILAIEEKIEKGAKIRSFKVRKDLSFDNLKDLRRYKIHCKNNIRKIFAYYLDSLASLPTASEFEERKMSGMGEHARIISQSFRILSKLIAKAGAIFIATNQERSSIGGGAKFKVTFGGDAMRYYATIRMRIAKVDVIEKSGEANSIVSLVKIIKNHVGKPFKKCRMFIDFGKGINNWQSAALSLEDKGMIECGAWKKFPKNSKDKKIKQISWQNEEGLVKVLTPKIKNEWKKILKEG